MKLKLAIIKWEDAQSIISKYEDLPEKCPIMRSVGYFYKTKNYHHVISLLDPDDNGQVSIIIPNGCIKDITYLK